MEKFDAPIHRNALRLDWFKRRRKLKACQVEILFQQRRGYRWAILLTKPEVEKSGGKFKWFLLIALIPAFSPGEKEKRSQRDSQTCGWIGSSTDAN